MRVEHSCVKRTFAFGDLTRKEGFKFIGSLCLHKMEIIAIKRKNNPFLFIQKRYRIPLLV